MTDHTDAVVARVLREIETCWFHPVLLYPDALRARAAELDKNATPPVPDTTVPPSGGLGQAAVPCPDDAHMGKFACMNRSQCWEPCGELGHSEQHARRVTPAVASPDAALDEAMEWLREYANASPFWHLPAKAKVIIAHIRQQAERIAELEKREKSYTERNERLQAWRTWGKDVALPALTHYDDVGVSPVVAIAAIDSAPKDEP